MPAERNNRSVAGHPDEAHEPRWVEPEIVVPAGGRNPDNASSGDGPPAGGRSRVGWAALLLAAAVLIIVISTVVRRTHQPPPAAGLATGPSSAASGLRTHDSAPSRPSSPGESSASQQVTASASTRPASGTPSGSAGLTSDVSITAEVAATDLLVPGNGFSYNASEGKITLAVRKLNIGSTRLTLTGPVRLVGPRGRPMPNASAVIVAGWFDQSGGYDSTRQTSHPLQSIAPHQKVTLVITARIKCASDSVERDWPKRYPIVIIPLANFTAPWSEPLGDVLDDSNSNLYQRVCS